MKLATFVFETNCLSLARAAFLIKVRSSPFSRFFCFATSVYWNEKARDFDEKLGLGFSEGLELGDRLGLGLGEGL
ncbi:MAG TPA: hypothetical protein VN414_08155 [Methanosarcina sp.]|nr:hypothetical protein [Methanosarcina sp.]